MSFLIRFCFLFSPCLAFYFSDTKLEYTWTVFLTLFCIYVRISFVESMIKLRGMKL